MKKTFTTLALVCGIWSGLAQADKLWTAASANASTRAQTTQRLSFPQDFTVMRLNGNSIAQTLQQAPQRNAARQNGVVIELPNAQGQLEHFSMLEASNFTPQLQAQFPNIRAYVGTGIEDPRATVRLSMDPRGLQAMIFRTDKRNEFIEPYSTDGKVYAIYNASRNKGALPFTCSTEDVNISKSVQGAANANRSNTEELLTFRLALSCNAEYTQYFGGTVAGALAAMNATMTRVNGVFEKDFAIHMTMVDNTSVIYLDPATDPYTTMGAWNNQLQTALTANIGEANYDVGHMFGASGGGGNAGCIGCVCVNNQKGRGITSPADGIPMGDNFDIDYVAHELGHQFGGNHTFSHNVEGSGVNVEPGSGSTIMGYAGITAYDIANHSDDYFVYASIKQVQDNMVGKSCPVRTPLTNKAPTADAGADYLIPISTPFVLTGAGTDPDGDPLTYCWEQNDSAVSGQTGNNSQASATKTGGPNWRSYDPTASPSRYFPPLARVVSNQLTSVFSGVTTEAVSSVGRVLNFALTVRDNVEGAGQTGSDFMKVTTVAAAGPFVVTAPNTAISVMAATSQLVTWDVAGTTANGVNCATVDILLSTDGGLTYPYTLASNTANDGSETINYPDVPGTQNRVMVKGHNHIFYDISNTNFTITTAATTFVMTPQGNSTQTACQGGDAAYSFLYETINGFDQATEFTATSAPVGLTFSVSPSPILENGLVNVLVTNLATAAPGAYDIMVTGQGGTETKTVSFTLTVYASTFAETVLTTPANGAITQPLSLDLSWEANANATSYEIEVASDADFTQIVSSGASDTTTFEVTGLTSATTYYWRVKPVNPSCSGDFGTAFSFQTGLVSCNDFAATGLPLTISATGAPTVNSTLVIGTDVGSVISGITVSTNITHTWVADLVLTLISPSGTQVRLIDNPCNNQDNINATFSDAGTEFTCGTNPAISGVVLPNQTLSALLGQNSAGTWTLRVQDEANQDGGSINAWSLNICTTQALAVKQQSFEQFAIYPNPNNGSFELQLRNDSNDAVQVSVHDLRGRQIFGQSFETRGLLQQRIALDHAQAGVYLVTVQSGDKKEVRKIVVQ